MTGDTLHGDTNMGGSDPRSKKLKRRISLQANTRESAMALCDKIIHAIVKHQILLFKNKCNSLEKAYAAESAKVKEAKILDDWIFIASSYCTILSDTDFQYIDELLVQIFAAFYIILRLRLADDSLIANLRYITLKNTDRHNINVLFQNLNSTIHSKHHHQSKYFSNIMDQVDMELTFPLVEETPAEVSNEENDHLTLDANHHHHPPVSSPRRSLDPNVMQNANPIKLPTSDNLSDFYPDVDVSSTSSNSTSTSIHSHINHIHIPTIDVERFEKLNTSSLLVINIRKIRLSSKHRHILTIDPSVVHDKKYFQTDVLPFIHNKSTIVMFSESPKISNLEESIYEQLVENDFINVYWLDGGFSTFQKHFISTNNIKKAPTSSNNNNLDHTIPLPKQGGKPQINSHSPERVPMAKPHSTLNVSPPPIPVARPVIPLSNDNSLSNATNGNAKKVSSQHLTYSSLIDAKNKQKMNPSLSSLPGTPRNRNSLYGLPDGISAISLQHGNQYDPIIHLENTQPQSRDSPALHPIPVNSGPGQVMDLQPPQLYQLSRLDYKPTINLRNLGSTCYINSMIQCLFSVKKFREFFIDRSLRQPYIHHSKTPETAPLTFGFYDLFQTFYDKSPHNSPPPTIDPRRFLSIINALNPSYNIPNEQQDTSQFLYYIIDELHKELKMSLEKSEELGFVKPQTHLSDDFNEWQLKNFQHEGFSYIQNLFNIKEAVVMKCSRCGYTSTRYDTSVMVHLSLKEKKSSLTDIIANNFLPEEMSSRFGNAWDCDGCKKAEKRLEELQEKLEKVHDMNMAQNKREVHEISQSKDKDDKKSKKKKFKFSISNKSSKDNNSSSDERKTQSSRDFSPLPPSYANILTDKEKSEYNTLADIFTRERIAFRSVELIELPEVLVFCLSLFNPSQQDAKVEIKDLKFPETLPLEFERCSRIYKLNSWIDHWGTSIDSGHYTATVPFSDNSWIQCDDDKLNGPNPRVKGSVRDNSVYLLFYEAV